MNYFKPKKSQLITLPSNLQKVIIEAAHSRAQISSLTHNYYKYPARFSPEFARTIIDIFTKSGDTVLDPFMGGGTTLIEGYARDRVTIGADISTLAEFVSQVKTTVLSARQIKQLKEWFLKLSDELNIHKPVNRHEDWIEKGYQRNLNSKFFWRIRKLVEQALNACADLEDDEQLRFARCVILKTAQWAFDGRKSIPSVSLFREALESNFKTMLKGHNELSQSIDRRRKKPICLNISANEVLYSKIWEKTKKPKLILTSPPYPGVHMLYHRWQVDGRKETPAPFWIANKLDGAGLSYYTMGDRKQHELKTYYENAKVIFSSLRKLSTPETIVVQIIAFSEPDWQLPKYLEMMKSSNFGEFFLSKSDSDDSRLWREVPNRKWYASQKGKTNSSKEVVLFHRAVV